MQFPLHIELRRSRLLSFLTVWVHLLAGGCVCCSFGNDLLGALLKLQQLEPAPGQTPLWPTVLVRALFDAGADSGALATAKKRPCSASSGIASPLSLSQT